MIPENSVVNINKSYANIIGNKSNQSFQSANNKIIIKLSINPILVLGCGINDIPQPSFLINGELHSFNPYKSDYVQNYLDENYPHCRKCLKWGTTSANCIDCKRKLNRKRDKVRKECQQKNINIKQIRSIVGKVKLESVCIRCSKKAIYKMLHRLFANMMN